MCDDIIVKMFPDFATQLVVKWIDSFYFGIFKSIRSAFVYPRTLIAIIIITKLFWSRDNLLDLD